MQEYVNRLLCCYDAREARAVIYRLLEDKYGLSRTSVCCGAIDTLSDEQKVSLIADIERLKNGEPVQYVTGMEIFHGLRFAVCEGVLIPRPETEEIVDWIMENIPQNLTPQVLDIGCGSGAISVSIASELKKLTEDICVTAWDISDAALRMTKQNAEGNDVQVNVVKQDALKTPNDDVGKYDIIVSNPPYVCQSEATTMTRQVLDHEPSLALFVPDNDPLLFYRAIAIYGVKALKKGGMLFFEINERYGNVTADMLSSLGYEHIIIRKDFYGKQRFVKATLLK